MEHDSEETLVDIDEKLLGRKAKRKKSEPERTITLDGCVDLTSPQWKRNYLAAFDLTEAQTYRRAFEVLIEPGRAGIVLNLPRVLQIYLGKLAYERFLETESTSPHDFADIGANLQPAYQYVNLVRSKKSRA